MITRSQLKWIFLSLVVLRLIVGFHFFTEGKNKIDQGNWSAAPFFAAAKGPMAPYFQSLLPDWNYRETLCVVPVELSDDHKLSPVVNRDKIATVPSAASFEIKPYRTFGQWDIFLEDILVGYRLKQSEIADRMAAMDREIKRLNGEIAAAQAGDDSSLENDLVRQRAQRVAVKDRLTKADPTFDLLEILKRRQDQLNDYLYFPAHSDEILKSVEDENRLIGFIRDGENRSRSGRDVESLRNQIDTIRGEIRSVRAKHAVEIQGIWNGLEEEMNAYGLQLSSPVETGSTLNRQVPLRKPFEIKPSTQLYWINTIIPYFDITVGILLLLGLFSRVASLAAAGFLLGTIATQPLWVPGHDPKIIWNMVEFGALLVMAATVAGRFGGLDYFLYRLFGKAEPEPDPSLPAQPD
ncbi:MAG: TQO small subunit DoxD [Pirellulaceae bacterium]|nr:TQO small subunit DoxD [Pirellulaceae bacterium]